MLGDKPIRKQINNLKISLAPWGKWQVRTPDKVLLEEFSHLDDAEKFAKDTKDFLAKKPNPHLKSYDIYNGSKANEVIVIETSNDNRPITRMRARIQAVSPGLAVSQWIRNTEPEVLAVSVQCSEMNKLGYYTAEYSSS